MGERPANAAGTRQRIPLRLSGICFGHASVLDADVHVGLDSFNVQLDNSGLSFIAQQEVAAQDAIHETVLSQACSTDSVAEDVEGLFLICVAVRVIKAHPMTGQVLPCRVIRCSVT